MQITTIHTTVFVALLAAAFALPSPAAGQANIPGLSAPDQAAAERVYPPKHSYSPYVGRNFPTRPFFGDTHLHTGFSFDAGAFGARLSPKEAYRFARGEEITASSGATRSARAN